jgi:hypothetical protein
MNAYLPNLGVFMQNLLLQRTYSTPTQQNLPENADLQQIIAHI